MKDLIRAIRAGIVATSTDDICSCGMRNGMRWCLGLVDDKEPTYENVKQPEIIRCKECKFYVSMIPKEKIGICSLACRHLGDDGFCSEAERREE